MDQTACAEEALLSIAIEALTAIRKMKGTAAGPAVPPTASSFGPGLEEMLKGFGGTQTTNLNNPFFSADFGCQKQTAVAQQPVTVQKSMKRKISTRILSDKIQALLPKDGSPLLLKKIVETLCCNGDIPDTTQETSNYVSVALTELKKGGVVGNGPGYKVGWRLIKKETATVPTAGNPVSRDNA
jgi:hypothetical protein